MTETPWAPDAATGIGSLPGTDAVEAARIVLGELPLLPHLPELPARGVGADVIGRTAALLVDIAVETVPSGYRVTTRPGRDHRRGVDLLRYDLDALEEVISASGVNPPVIKVQLAGPWTLTANIELARGHRILTDHGALREFTESLSEGLREHVAEVTRRTSAKVIVQLDEPSLPDVLNGRLLTPSGYGTVRAVPEPEARPVLTAVVEAAKQATGQPVIVHCCADRPPLDVLRSCGVDAICLDMTRLDLDSAGLADEIGEAWDAGLTLFLGLVPTSEPDTVFDLRTAARPAFDLVDRLGFSRSYLADRAVPTPGCGLAGASADWARRTMTLARELGKTFVEPPEGW